MSRLAHAAFFALAIVLAISPRAFAGKVRCPVCGQVFEDTVEHCPNDGTDLAISGKPVEEEPEEEAEPEPVEEDAGEGYRRQDRGGERMRIEDDDGSGYSERHKRFADDRGKSEEAAARKRKAHERRRREFEEEDARLRARFEERRAAWRESRGEDADSRLPSDESRGHDRPAAPLTSIGLRLSWLPRGREEGRVMGAEAEVNPLRRWYRAGGAVFLGIRNLDEADETVFLGKLSAGVQLPWTYSPYVVATGGLGVLSRRGTGEGDGARLLGSVGAEAGIDCHLTRSIAVTPTLGWVHYFAGDDHFDSFTFRVSLGF